MPIPTAAERRLAAIKVLHIKIAALEKDKKAAAAVFNKDEKEALERRDKLIEESVPAAKACRDRILELQQAHAQLKTIRGDKKRDAETRSQRIAEFEGYLTEAIVASIDVEQQSLDLGDTQSLAPGLALTPGALKAIGVAANDHVSRSAAAEKDPDSDVADLLATITSMGLSGFTLSGETAEGSGPDSGEETAEPCEDAAEDPETDPGTDPPF